LDEWDIQEEYQEPDNVPAGVAEEPAIPEMEQVMRWIGFDELKAKRWQLRLVNESVISLSFPTRMKRC
jgi:hypothetical protein